MRRIPFVFLLVLLSTGCANQRALVAEQQATLDSLYAANQGLRTELSTLQDSLQFIDDIDSGYYFREKNRMQREIDRLEFALTQCREGGRTVATLLVDDLFAPATAELTPQGAARVAELVETLAELGEGRRIRVEGHSDGVPIGGSLKERYPTNWELSAARAAAVVRQLTEVHELPVGAIEAVAFGASRPVARNDTAAGRRQNRRVRVAVVGE